MEEFVMPIYEYRCAKCEHIFEELQGFSDPPPEECPSCQAKGEVSRLVSRSSFHLQGGGWYADDYGGTGSSGTAGGKADDGGTTSSDSGADSGAGKSDAATSTEAAAE
jgi:putative FmdB family regulatory protein